MRHFLPAHQPLIANLCSRPKDKEFLKLSNIYRLKVLTKLFAINTSNVVKFKNALVDCVILPLLPIFILNVG